MNLQMRIKYALGKVQKYSPWRFKNIGNCRKANGYFIGTFTRVRKKMGKSGPLILQKCHRIRKCRALPLSSVWEEDNKLDEWEMEKWDRKIDASASQWRPISSMPHNLTCVCVWERVSGMGKMHQTANCPKQIGTKIYLLGNRIWKRRVNWAERGKLLSTNTLINIIKWRLGEYSKCEWIGQCH
jgi:hypothetical protein